MTRLLNYQNLNIESSYIDAELKPKYTDLYGGLIIYGEYPQVMAAMSAAIKNARRKVEAPEAVIRMTDLQDIAANWRKSFKEGSGSEAEERMRACFDRVDILGVYFLSEFVVNNLKSPSNNNFLAWLKGALSHKFSRGGVYVGCTEKIAKEDVGASILFYSGMEGIAKAAGTKYGKFAAEDMVK